MIDPKVQQFLDHCVNVLKVDTITNKTAEGEERWDEVATLGDVVMIAEYTDRDYESDSRVNIKYVVWSEYTLKVPLDKFLTFTRADIERIGQQAAALDERYKAMQEECKQFLVDAKKQMKDLLP